MGLLSHVSLHKQVNSVRRKNVILQRSLCREHNINNKTEIL